MVNTRSKTKILKTSSSSQASTEDSDRQPIESGDLIGSNDDLLTEILLRLPVTSILRFKSVSKHWRSLLSHRRFILRYDKSSKSLGLFARDVYVPFDVENRSTPPIRNLNFRYDPRGIRIVQSCNGLLLCCSDRGKQRARKYYVFNPTTKQFKILPLILGGQDARETICFMGLAFHQTDCVHYKVVCILILDHRARLFQIQVYSSDTRKWKISIESFSSEMFSFSIGVYWSGAIHWAPSNRDLFYFKIDVEQLQSLPLLAEMMWIESRSPTMYFGESRGHLHLIVSDDDHQHNRLRLNVYEVLMDHSGWLVKYQVELDELPGAFPQMLHPTGCEYNVIDVVRGEKEEDTFMVLLVTGKLITYNVHDNSFKKIFTLTEDFYDGRLPFLCTFHRYSEALACF